MNPAQQRALMRTRYRVGGRVIGREIDCWGTVLYILDLRGVPKWDPWDEIRSAWRANKLDLTCVSGFPPEHWSRVSDGSVVDGDVWLFHGSETCAAIVHHGQVWTASSGVGFPHCKPVAKWPRNPNEVWRYADGARS